EMVRNNGIDINRILVLTFTRKAAAEMAERIEERLIELAGEAQDKSEANRLLIEASKVVDASIETIDSFAVRLLRENAAAIGLDPDFSVADPAENLIHGELVAKQCLEKWVESPPNTIWPEAITHTPIENWPSFLTKIDSFLMTRGHVTKARLLLGRDENPGEEIAKVLGEQKRKIVGIKEELVKLILKNIDTLDSYISEYATSVKSPSVVDKALRIKADLPALKRWLLNRDLNWEDEIISNVSGWNIQWGSKKTEEGSLPKFIRTNIDGIIKDDADPYENLKLVDTEIRAWDNRVALADAIVDFHNAFLDARRKKNVLSFGDCEIEVLDLLESGDPGVGSKLRKQYEYVVVDEYQDINPLQEKIIFALSKMGENKTGPPSNLYAVGDERQSIYRFRGADNTLLAKLRKTAGAIDRDGAGCRILHESFRSRSELINLVNHAFRTIWTDKSMHSDLAPAFKPYLNVLADEIPGEAKIELHLIKAPDTASGRPLEASAIARRLAEIVRDEKLHVWKRSESGPISRPINWGDCAVLLRTRNVFTFFEDAFASLGIPCTPESGGGFWGRREIGDIIALLACMSPVYEDIDWAILLRSPWVGISDDSLVEIADSLKPGGGWAEMVGNIRLTGESDRKRLEFFRNWFYKIEKIAGRISSARIVEEALFKSGYSERVFAENGGRLIRANIEKLIGLLVNEQYGSDAVTSVKILRRLRESEFAEAQAGLASTDEEGKVTLATVHAAKGLEWPLVILPDLIRGRNLGREEIVQNDREGIFPKWRHPGGRSEKTSGYVKASRINKLAEDEEERRLLYVALTRAREHLILSGVVKEKENKDGVKWVFNSNTWLGRLNEALTDTDAFIGKPGDAPEANISIMVADPLNPDEYCGCPVPQNKRGTTLAIRRVIHYDPQPVKSSSREKSFTEIQKDLEVAMKKNVRLPAMTSRRYLASVTEIAAFNHCPRMYAYRVLWNVPPRPSFVQPIPESDIDSDPDDEPHEDGIPQRETIEFPASTWGTLCHRVLERVDFNASYDEIRKAAGEILAGSANEKTRDKLTKLISNSLKLEIFNRVRKSDDIRREFRLLGMIDGTDEVLLGIIDLYAIADGRPIIIDYKSGKISDEKIKSRVEEYSPQLVLYAHLIGGYTGVNPCEVDARIVFLDPPVEAPIDLSGEVLSQTLDIVRKLTEFSKKNNFTPTPSPEKCLRCDWRDICQDSQYVERS
ncbi:MAG: UvrD-helicase domain-containing protein, partial [bacterium]